MKIEEIAIQIADNIIGSMGMTVTRSDKDRSWLISKIEQALLSVRREALLEAAKKAETKFERCCMDEKKCDMEKAGEMIGEEIRALSRDG